MAQGGRNRSDVAAAFGASYQHSGFSISVNGLAAGAYQLSAFARSSVTGQFEGSASVSVTIAGGPAMAMDEPAANSTVAARFTIVGWAIDRDSATGTGVDTVHVWAYPISTGGTSSPPAPPDAVARGGPLPRSAPAGRVFDAASDSPRFVGVATYGGARSDVGAAFGSRFTNSGWTLTGRGLPAGTWTIVASAHSPATDSFRQSVAATVQVQSGVIVQIDIPSGPSATRPFQIIGWAVDLAAVSGAGISAVHVYAFPVGGGSAVFIGAGTLGQNRTDVGAVFGSQFNGSGYQLTWTTSLPAGTYDLVAYAQSAVSGTFDALKVIRLTVN